MGRKKIDITGNKYGRLTVIGEYGKSNNGETVWKCECQCGKKAYVTGSNLRNGHNATCGHCLTFQDCRECVIASDSRGRRFLFDNDDMEKVSKYIWFVSQATGYVYTDSLGKKRMSLHRFVMNAPKNVLIDHVNCQKNDCRKANLRFATIQQNHFNLPLRGNNKSGYKGVWYDGKRRKYEASIVYCRHKYHLGRHDTPEEAAHAYNRAALLYFGEFARLNNINLNSQLFILHMRKSLALPRYFMNTIKIYGGYIGSINCGYDCYKNYISAT